MTEVTARTPPTDVPTTTRRVLTTSVAARVQPSTQAVADFHQHRPDVSRAWAGTQERCPR